MSRKRRCEGPAASGDAAPVRGIAEEEAPKARLLRSGARSLSDAELLALLLRRRRPGSSALELARDLLRESGGLCGLVGVNPVTLQNGRLGQSDGAVLLATLELACRLAQGQIPQRTPLSRGRRR